MLGRAWVGWPQELWPLPASLGRMAKPATLTHALHLSRPQARPGSETHCPPACSSDAPVMREELSELQ